MQFWRLKLVMKPVVALILGSLALALVTRAGAEEIGTVKFGNAEVVSDYEVTQSGLAILTLNALISETNNSLRGLKNSDRERLSKLGQLIYQCKLMLYKPSGGGDSRAADDHLLISKNYSLYTGVELTLPGDQRMGIRVQALPEVDEASLFSASLGGSNPLNRLWETPSQQGVIDLAQFDVNILQESDVIETSESIDIAVRFPVFQLEKPVREWSYNFVLGDFKRAVRHIDEHCTPARLTALIENNS